MRFDVTRKDVRNMKEVWPLGTKLLYKLGNSTFYYILSVIVIVIVFHDKHSNKIGNKFRRIIVLSRGQSHITVHERISSSVDRCACSLWPVASQLVA